MSSLLETLKKKRKDELPIVPEVLTEAELGLSISPVTGQYVVHPDKVKGCSEAGLELLKKSHPALYRKIMRLD